MSEDPIRGNVTTPELRERIRLHVEGLYATVDEAKEEARVVPPPDRPSEPFPITDLRPKSGPKLITDTATKNGWLVRATSGRGPKMHASQGIFLRMVDTLTLYGRRRLYTPPIEQRFSARWVDGGFETGYVWLEPSEDGTFYPTRVNSSELKEALKS